MSAYIVSNRHIQYLVEAAICTRFYHHDHLRWEGGQLTNQDHAGKQRVGQMLLDENHRSVNYRYNEDDSELYEHAGAMPHETFEPVQVLKACDCYEYQACEHPGWQESQAKSFIDALRKRAYRSFPGYEDAEWGPPQKEAQQLESPKHPFVPDVRFNKYHVTDGETKARCHYSLDNRIDGRKCVTIYAKDYANDLPVLFPGHYENQTDLMTDYFDKGKVVLFEDHPHYPAARERAEANQVKASV